MKASVGVVEACTEAMKTSTEAFTSFHRESTECRCQIFRRNSSLQTVCDSPIARITGCASSSKIYFGDSPCNYSVAIRVNRVILVRLCAETIKPGFEGDKL